MTILPLSDNIVLKRAKPEERKGALFVPEAAQSDTNIAIVVAAGPGKLGRRNFDGDFYHLPMNVGPGDKVLIGKWAGETVTIDDEEYLVTGQDKILAVLSEA